MLKQWLIDNGHLAADAKEADVDAAVEKAMADTSDKKLTFAKYKSLLAEKSPEQKIADDRAEFAKTIAKSLADILKPAAPAPEATKEAPATETKTAEVDLDKVVAEKVAAALATQKTADHQVEKVFKLASTLS